VTFTKPALALLDAAKILGVRAGSQPHRFIAVWVVVLNGRVFVRTWNDKPGGWYRAFLGDPVGAVQAGERVLRVRARKTRGDRLLAAIDDAYAAKYTTPGARKYVRGFRTPTRRVRTLELLPR
jgi:hypothetical protein